MKYLLILSLLIFQIVAENYFISASDGIDKRDSDPEYFVKGNLIS